MDTAETTSIACTIGALDAREQARRRDLAARMRAATRQMRELPDGYAFRYPVDLCLSISEFIALERRCCPFLPFRARGGAGRWSPMVAPDRPARRESLYPDRTGPWPRIGRRGRMSLLPCPAPAPSR